MYETVGDEKHDNKRVKGDSEKFHISMTKLCRCLKCPSSIGEKRSDWFQHKCYRRSQEVMYPPESDEIPHEEEIQYEHDSTHQYVAQKLYNMFIPLSKTEEVLSHA
jgi:hypothetical protein